MIPGVIASAARNWATGGTESTFTYGGRTWRRHVFTASGTLSVLLASETFRVTMHAGGGESGFGDPPGDGGTAGGGGGGYQLDVALAAGDYAATVGGQGADTTLAGVGTVGGGGHGMREFNGTGRTDGRPGTWGGTSNGGDGLLVMYGTPEDPAVALRTLIDGTVGTWGEYGPQVDGGSGTNPGTAGAIIVEYPV